jgi:hypothetical protein
MVFIMDIIKTPKSKIAFLHDNLAEKMCAKSTTKLVFCAHDWYACTHFVSPWSAVQSHHYSSWEEINILAKFSPLIL